MAHRCERLASVDTNSDMNGSKVLLHRPGKVRFGFVKHFWVVTAYSSVKCIATELVDYM
jgi:hypothetical protein